jgi:dipeptidyl aminopeptidase/acylaminoacyl peptidase
MRPDQLDGYRVPSDARLHPDGARVAFVVTQADLDDERYVRRIWLWDGTEARPITAGPSDASPRWSPDGARLAFLRASGDDPAQIAVLPTEGGEATVVSQFALGVREVEWSPAGDRLAAVATSWTAEYAELDEEARTAHPRRIRRLPYRADGTGWTHDRRSHVYLVDPGGADPPVCLTPGDFDEAEVAWHPEGTELCFVSARHESAGLDPGNQVFTVPVGGGAARAASSIGLWTHPAYDRAGTLYALGAADRWDLIATRRLHRLDGVGDEEPQFSHLDRNLDSLSPPLSPSGPRWLGDGSALSTLEDAGCVRVIRLNPDGTTTDVLGGNRVIMGIDPTPDGSSFVYTASAPTSPGELWRWESGVEHQLTRLNEEFTASTSLTTPQRFEFDADGLVVEGWVYLPDTDDEVPLLLNIHGGPATQYGYGFFDEFQVYVAAGYGVVAINPRGSSGRGEAHARAVAGRWGEELPPDMADFATAIDVAAATFPQLDTTRLGIMGGSYGGLATIIMLSLDQRFRSAVAERGLYSWPSFHGTSDIGPWFTRIYLGTDMARDPAVVWEASPLARVGTIETPTLIVHSAGDRRTPLEQADQLFVRLLQSGVDTEMLVFPDNEGHELSRSGTPRHRQQRFEAILDWHDRHLR